MTTTRAGCFERHLLRRRNDPLFPSDRRLVAAAELVGARERDRAERENLEARIADLLGRFIDGPDSVSSRQAVDCLQECHHLSVAVCQADQSLDEELAALLSAYKELSLSAQQVSEPTEVEHLAAAAQSLHRQLTLLRAPLLATMSRPESPMRHDELVPSMLRLSVADLATCLNGVRLLGAEVFHRCLSEAAELLHWAAEYGVQVDGADEKRQCLSMAKQNGV